MAIYSTFFLAEPSQLPTAFPGWKSPLPKPVIRTTVNPFTREEMTITTCEPEWDDFALVDMELPKPQVMAFEGNYQMYLERRIPPLVQSWPHWCAKNLTNVELGPLIAATSGIANSKLECAFYAHPSLSCGIEQFPDDFLFLLKSGTESKLATIAQKWAATMSTPEYTHSINGERLTDDWSSDDAFSLLKRIAELASHQSSGQIMYLLLEW